MNSAGNVRWRTDLPRPVTALEIDPLGRLRRSTGTPPARSSASTSSAARSGRIDPPGAAGRGGAKASSPSVRTSTGGVRTPDWVVPGGRHRPAGRDGGPRRGRRSAADRPVHQPAPAPVCSTPPARSWGQAADLIRCRPAAPHGTRLARRRDRPSDPPLRPEA